ncbi:MAG: ATP-grasp domain-containing protein [Pseudomonadota bacterium]
MVVNVFVLGLEPFNLRLLKKVRRTDAYRFHGLLDVHDVAGRGPFDVEALLDEANATLDAFDGTVDAIVGYWDFPTQLLLAVLRGQRGLTGPSLESVLRCEHKYWARLDQQEVAPDVVPAFAWVDPFADDADRKAPLDYPFWLKPVKAHSSLLGFRVGDRDDLARAIRLTRAGIDEFSTPLARFLERADLPPQIAALPSHACIAERMIAHGRQCTLEGYVHAGKARIYGVVDSVRGPNRHSFERYEYPSTLPQAVQEEMAAIACRIAEHAGLDATPFNIEFFWDRRHDRLALLELNVRISKSHSPLFEKVTGVPHNEVMLDVALGREPDYPPADKRFAHAAKFMPRIYGEHDDARVEAVPDAAAIEELEARFPGTDIQMHLKPGTKLGRIRHRDSYSYELATIFMGAPSHAKLMENYRACREQLGVRIEGIEG